MSKNKNQITVFKAFIDLDKEVAYINEMNKKGWKLVYIKGGCYYTFVKTEPGEYVTMLYADKKENLSSVTAFAAQCGYECVPHTMDGFGEMIYFTGKKSEVSEEFVTDNKARLESLKTIYKKCTIMTGFYYAMAIMILVFDIILVIPDITEIFVNNMIDKWLPFVIVMSILNLVFIVLILVTVFVTRYSIKLRRQIRKLSKEQNIYE